MLDSDQHRQRLALPRQSELHLPGRSLKRDKKLRSGGSVDIGASVVSPETGRPLLPISQLLNSRPAISDSQNKTTDFQSRIAIKMRYKALSE